MKNTGGFTRSLREFICEPSTKYAFRGLHHAQQSKEAGSYFHTTEDENDDHQGDEEQEDDFMEDD